MLRSFPFQGEHFFNLQWRSGNVGHFICGNGIYAKPHSRHPRKVRDVDHLLLRWAWPGLWGSGPKLPSDYIASADGRELQEHLFSPAFFNPIDWTEVDRFDRPVAQLAALSQRRAAVRRASVECPGIWI